MRVDQCCLLKTGRPLAHANVDSSLFGILLCVWDLTAWNRRTAGVSTTFKYRPIILDDKHTRSWATSQYDGMRSWKWLVESKTPLCAITWLFSPYPPYIDWLAGKVCICGCQRSSDMSCYKNTHERNVHYDSLPPLDLLVTNTPRDSTRKYCCIIQRNVAMR